MPLEDGEWDDATETIDTIDYREPGSQVSTDSGSVEPSSGPSRESHRATQDESSGSAEPSGTPEPDLPAFDPRYREDFEGLMYLGKLTDTFDWMGHRFTIRTLVTDEILEVGIVHKPYVGSLADVKAYQAAVVAACVESVDGRPISIPLTNNDEDTSLRNKFNYVRRNWFPPVLDVIYEKYLLLEVRVSEVLDAMKKASG